MKGDKGTATVILLAAFIILLINNVYYFSIKAIKKAGLKSCLNYILLDIFFKIF